MSYPNGLERSYVYPAQAFTSPITRHIKPPPKCNRGRITDLHVSVTVLFTAVTTQGFVNVGTAGDTSKYASLGMGTAAANTGYNARDFAGAIKSDIDMVRDNVSSIQLATVAPTGGTPAGTGDVNLCIAWS